MTSAAGHGAPARASGERRTAGPAAPAGALLVGSTCALMLATWLAALRPGRRRGVPHLDRRDARRAARVLPGPLPPGRGRARVDHPRHLCDLHHGDHLRPPLGHVAGATDRGPLRPRRPAGLVLPVAPCRAHARRAVHALLRRRPGRDDRARGLPVTDEHRELAADRRDDRHHRRLPHQRPPSARGPGRAAAGPPGQARAHRPDRRAHRPAQPRGLRAPRRGACGARRRCELRAHRR